MTRGTSAQRRKPNWTPEQREAARQRAYKLIEAGKFGGAAGRGGRPRKRSPTAADLLLILRAQQKGLATFDHDDVVLDSIGALAQIAHTLNFDREHAVQLVAMATVQLSDDGQLPSLALVDGTTVEAFWPASREAKKRAKDHLDNRVSASKAARVVSPGDLTPVDVARFSDAELIEMLGLMGVMTRRVLLREAITAALMDTVRLALPFVLDEIARRKKAVAGESASMRL